MKQKPWGQLLLINLYGCERRVLTSRAKLKEFCAQLCSEVGMVPFGEPIMKRFGKGKLRGYSLMQFIQTSSITVHLDEVGRRAFIDIFSCKPFDAAVAKRFSKVFFGAKRVRSENVYR